VLLKLDFPILLLRASHTLLSDEEQSVLIPALSACDESAAEAVEQARVSVERLRRERTERDIESWSTLPSLTAPAVFLSFLNAYVGALYDQPVLAEGEEEVTCGICLSDVEPGSRPILLLPLLKCN
jgi:hypothetical protein